MLKAEISDLSRMQPLAERMRPKSLDDYVGQKHLVGQGAVLRQAIESGQLPSFVLWGPPGVGKTSLAKIIAQQLDIPFFTLSAVNSGVKDVRETIEKARRSQFFDRPNPVLGLPDPAFQGPGDLWPSSRSIGPGPSIFLCLHNCLQRV